MHTAHIQHKVRLLLFRRIITPHDPWRSFIKCQQPTLYEFFFAADATRYSIQTTTCYDVLAALSPLLLVGGGGERSVRLTTLDRGGVDSPNVVQYLLAVRRAGRSGGPVALQCLANVHTVAVL
jgi:hypothetical protein